MTKATFVHYLQHPELIATAPLAEVEALANRYPYSTNAQVLLALCAELSADPRREALFARAATMTFDRGHLYDLFTTLHQSPPPAEEESLELLPLEEIGAVEPVLLGSDFSPAAPTLSYSEILNEDQFDLPEVEEMTSSLSTLDQVEPWDYSEPPASEAKDDVDTAATTQDADQTQEAIAESMDAASPSEVTVDAADNADLEPILSSSADTHPAQLSPRPPADFTQRRPIATREELRRRLQLIRQRQALGNEEAPPAKKVARRSLVVSDGAISSTLAEVFKEQGQYQHAIRVYEQLALANPEKRPIFAALIQDLKRKIP